MGREPPLRFETSFSPNTGTGNTGTGNTVSHPILTVTLLNAVLVTLLTYEKNRHLDLRPVSQAPAGALWLFIYNIDCITKALFSNNSTCTASFSCVSHAFVQQIELR